MKTSSLSNKYALALLQSDASKNLKQVHFELGLLARAYQVDKVKQFIALPVSTHKKVNALLGLLENPSKEIQRFLKVLDQKDRLGFIGEIFLALDKQIAIQDNVFNGFVFSNGDLAKSDIERLQDGLSKKLGKTICLTFAKSDFDGVRVELDALGLEVSFSKATLKKRLMSHILKAI